ncbi:hypothetical protein JL108_02880 [Aeromicrobium sp. YIM 150415]|uniref:hypothetical protein n=1 Tax=Aeromicrobium sp. YIM 150415 TaxID=2803912 RepID=UPI0019663384|nr:hypothetical protein [Aeromicrobium sp. YIM 150415]MBM9462377.1 hypothetical protein [Aeromicrobium sp. YIM 150415]
MRVPGLFAGVTISAFLLAGCTSDPEPSTSSGDLSALPAGGMIGLSDRAAVRDIAGEDADDPWKVAAGSVAGPLGSYERYLAEELEIDLSAADRVLYGGEGPSAVLLVLGGQDPAAVTAAARDAGWSGDEVLSHEGEGDNGLTVPVTQLRVEDDRVIVGGIGSDLSRIGETAGDDETTRALVDCLDDPLAALVASPAETPHAVGVRDVDGEARSTICLIGDEDDGDRVAEAVDGTMPSGRPYDELIADPEVETVGDAVRITVTNTSDAQPATIVQMMLRRELPGLT